MKHDYTVEYGRVKLCPLSQDDAEKMRILRNQNSSRFFDTNIITQEQQRKWYELYLSNEYDYMFSVYLVKSEQWVGAVSIYNVDSEKKEAEFGRLLIDKQNVTEKGLGLDTTLAACQFAFDKLGLNTVFLEVMQDNIAAVKTYERAAFSIFNERKTENGKNILCMKITKK